MYRHAEVQRGAADALQPSRGPLTSPTQRRLGFGCHAECDAAPRPQVKSQPATVCGAPQVPNLPPLVFVAPCRHVRWGAAFYEVHALQAFRLLRSLALQGPPLSIPLLAPNPCGPDAGAHATKQCARPPARMLGAPFSGVNIHAMRRLAAFRSLRPGTTALQGAPDPTLSLWRRPWEARGRQNRRSARIVTNETKGRCRTREAAGPGC